MVNAWLWRISLGGAVLVWMGLIFYLSSLSQKEASEPLESVAVSWLGDLRSYVAHLVLFGVLASLTQALLWGWRWAYQLRWAVCAATFAALYGISDEYHQSSVDGRSASIVDVLVNLLGAVVAAGSLWLVATWWRGHEGNPPQQSTS